MRLSSVCGLLLLCVHFYFVDAGNVFSVSSSHGQRREIKPEFTPEIITVRTVSPTWYLHVGDTVELNCTGYNKVEEDNHLDKGDLQLVWTKIPGDRTKKVLVRQRASERISYVLGPVTHEHQGIYSCNDGGSFSDVYVHDWHQMIWVADASQRASMDVISHNRNVFFRDEVFTVSCQLPDDNTKWKLMRHIQWTENITECPNQVSSGRRLSCTLPSPFPWTDELFWCENPAGERSNALNITSTISRLVLEIPSVPVLEGEDVTLRCVYRNRTNNEISSNFSAIYYKDYKEIGHGDDGHTLKAVTKADEGLYNCYLEEEGDSYYSYLYVKARTNEDQKKSDDVIKTQ